MNQLKSKMIRTEKCKISNYNQVESEAEHLSESVCKVWNTVRYRCEEIWKETGEIPSELELKSFIKDHGVSDGLHSQTVQNVVEELWDAFKGWFEKRKSDNNARPPKYRKRGSEYPKVSVTYKKSAIRHDKKNGRLKLSNGRGGSPLLIDYTSKKRVDNINIVRLVWNGEKWQVHITYEQEVQDIDSGDGYCAIDLGIKNLATLVFDDGASEMYPSNRLKEDEYYFLKEKAKCNKPNSNKAKRLEKKRSRRREHFLHALTKNIVETCKEKNVGTIVVGDLSGIRSKNYNDNFNLKISQWTFDKFTELLQYKAEEVDITVRKVSEKSTSKTCSNCGVVDSSNRTQRGLYECSSCSSVVHADVNGACNILKKVTTLSGSNGCLAQPSVNLFAVRSGNSNEQGKFRQKHLKTLKSQASQACA